MKNYITISLVLAVAMLGFITIKQHRANSALHDQIAVLQTQTLSGVLAQVRAEHKNSTIRVNAYQNTIDRAVEGQDSELKHQQELEDASNSIQSLQALVGQKQVTK